MAWNIPFAILIRHLLELNTERLKIKHSLSTVAIHPLAKVGTMDDSSQV
jgi:hypothetical protein